MPEIVNPPAHPSASEWEEALHSSETQSRAGCEAIRHEPHLQAFMQMLPPPARILEAGCGLGQFVYGFAAAGYDCVGLDFSENLIARARQRGRELTDLHSRIEWIVGDILQLPLPDASLDGYVSFGVLEHFSEPDQLRILGEAYRVLRPGGVLYQYVPNFWSPWTVRRQLRYWFRLCYPPRLVWQRNISKRKLARLCRAAGFDQKLLQSFYAATALESLGPPGVLQRLAPTVLRRGCKAVLHSAGRVLDGWNLGGYTLAYIGRKPAA